MGSKRFFYILATHQLGRKVLKLTVFIETDDGFPSFLAIKKHAHQEAKEKQGTVTIDYIYEFETEADYLSATRQEVEPKELPKTE